MKKAEIKLGGIYTARVGGRYTKVRVDCIRTGFGFSREQTFYDCTNLTTGRVVTFRSAAKFRGEARPDASDLLEEMKADPVLTSLNDANRAALDAAVQEAIETSEMSEEERAEWEAANAEEASEESDPTPAPSVGLPGATATTDRQSLATLTATSYPTKMPTETPSEPTNGGATASSAGSTSLGLAAKIAAIATTPKVAGLTEQQQAILDAGVEIETARGNGQRVLVIGAGAGTGKTFTLKQLEEVLRGNGQYTAFNSSLVAESKAKFRRAACNTTHSLAFRAVGRRYAHRLNGPRVRSQQIAATLGIEDFYVELPASLSPPETMPDGTTRPATRRLKAAWLAGQVTAAITRFCMSADAEIGPKHFKRIDGIDDQGSYANSDKVKGYLLPYAKRAWADLSIPEGRLPFSHDHYVKIWQLGTGPDRPVIAADYILLDEAQDTAEVMLDILRQQTHALLILVGDDNQQIYEWRGAVNAMASFPGAPRRLLSQSFRFGQAVADVANAILAGLEQPTDLVMRGLESIPTRVCPVAEPACFLYRTNAGAIGRLMRGIGEGKRGHLIGGTKEVVAFCKAAEDLQAGLGTSHPELGCFSRWEEVQEYSKEDEGADLRLMVKLIDEFGAAEIRAALDGMPREEDADFVVSTAHRSKGREWASVRLGPDFPLANKLSDADRRLIYVAATRAQEELDLTECPTFCGGEDRQGGGEDGSGGESRWVPGLDITYTVEMPSADDLAAYRAAKSAPKAAPAPAPASRPAPAPVGAPGANVAPANGLPAANGQEYTWANMGGQWTVRGPAGKLGERVTVTRKNGTTSVETLRTKVRQIGEVWFYGVK